MSGGYHGYYKISTDRIAIDAGVSANGQVKTRVYWLAHVLTAATGTTGPRTGPRQRGAGGRIGGVTCVGALGVRTDGYSVPYLASWAEQADLSVLEQTAALVDRLASRIETAAVDPNAQYGITQG